MESVVKGNVTLLTGLPRSGTTLLCALLNELPDTVALVEPIEFKANGDHGQAVEQIDRFIVDSRAAVVGRGEITTRHIGGYIPDNLVDPPGDRFGLRHFHPERGVIPLGREVAPNFGLFIKHLGEFTAMADALAAKYPVVAIVRNPLHLLASWQTVDLPIRLGHLRSAECFSPGVRRLLAAEPLPLRRQVILLQWMLEIYREFPAERVLRYEDLIANPQRSLSRLHAPGQACCRRVYAYDAQRRYPGTDVAAIARELQPIAPLIGHFYPDFGQQLSTNGIQ